MWKEINKKLVQLYKRYLKRCSYLLIILYKDAMNECSIPKTLTLTKSPKKSKQG